MVVFFTSAVSNYTTIPTTFKTNIIEIYELLDRGSAIEQESDPCYDIEVPLMAQSEERWMGPGFESDTDYALRSRIESHPTCIIVGLWFPSPSDCKDNEKPMPLILVISTGAQRR